MLHRYLSSIVLLLLVTLLQAQPASQVIISATWGRSPGHFAHAMDGDEAGPSCFAVDALGNLFVADDINDRIQQFNPTGKFVAAFSKPRGESIDGLAISLRAASAGRGSSGRTIYTADFSWYNQQRLLVGKVENKTVRPVKLSAPPLMIHGLATDSRRRLFVETQGDTDHTPSVRLFDSDLHYRGQREISDLCVQPGSDSLVGVSQKRAIDGKLGLQRWTVQFMSPTDMQYTVAKTVEIEVPARKNIEGVTQLLGVDTLGNFYVLADAWGNKPEKRTTRLLRYSPTGAQTGILNLDAFLRTNRYLLYPERNIRITPKGDVYIASGTEKRYVIQRINWSQAGK